MLHVFNSSCISIAHVLNFLEAFMQVNGKCFVVRYKLICLETWPNVRGTDRLGTKIILDSLDLLEQVAFGNTKIFIRDPQSLAELENTRSTSLPDIALILQRVGVITSVPVYCVAVSYLQYYL